MTTDIITCDVCDRVISKSRFARHRMSLNCKCTANIQLYVKYNFFDLDIDNMLGKTGKMLHGKFEGGFELTDYERGQDIKLCKSVYNILKEQFDIRYERIYRWFKLYEKMIIY